jgi:chloramphenicol 3-O phosphotransferase
MDLQRGGYPDPGVAVGTASRVAPAVIVLNGGSSAGKSVLAVALQEALPEAWLRLSVDTLIRAMPPWMTSGGPGISFGADGEVGLGAEFTRLELAWMRGVAAIARAGAPVIVEDGFLSGPVAQERWRSALEQLPVLWVGVRCDAEVAAERERARGDRGLGMARRQAESVHRGIAYDLEVDMTHATPTQAAEVVVAAVRDRGMEKVGRQCAGPAKSSTPSATTTQ